MALPVGSIDQLNDDATNWRLLEPWGASPNVAPLARHAVYRFQARWAHDATARQLEAVMSAAEPHEGSVP
jgi:hypothetical protein